MQKNWDKALPNIEAFKQMNRILKPGGIAFVMSSPRQDVLWRMLQLLEKSGFELKQSFVSWIYKCVSEDTTILTKSGWKGIDEVKEKELVCTFNYKKEKLEYKPILEIFKYIYEGKMVNIKNRDTDQLLTLNHRVLHKDRKHSGNKYYDGNWEFTEAKDLVSHQGVNLPLAYKCKEFDDSIGINLAELIGWVIGEGWFQKESNAVNISQCKKENVIRIRNLIKKLNFEFSEYKRKRKYKGKLYIEHQFHIHAKYGKIIRKIIPNKIPTIKLIHLPLEEKEVLFEALILGEGSGKLGKNLTFYQKDVWTRKWFQILCLHLGFKTSSFNNKKQYLGISIKHSTQLQYRHFKEGNVKEINYKGRVWCVRTENNTFVAKRNNKIFITGNSGFPKAFDVSKKIDKKLGKKRTKYKKVNPFPDGGKRKKFGVRNNNIYERGDSGKLTELEDGLKLVSEPVSGEAKKWEGYKSISGLKPALECILMVNKPLEGKIVDNVLKYSTGAINVDDCRIPCKNEKIQIHNNPEPYSFKGNKSNLDYRENVKGRFPSNLLVSDKAIDNGKISKTGNLTGNKVGLGDGNIYGKSKLRQCFHEGDASRFFDLDNWFNEHAFFDVPKPSRSERNRGLTKSFINLESYLIDEDKCKGKSIIKGDQLVRLQIDMESFPLKVTEGYGLKSRNAIVWNMMLFGKSILGKYQKDFMYIIKMGTSLITPLKILNWLMFLLTKEYMVDVKRLEVNGGNHVENVENTSQLVITINEKMASVLGVKNVVSGTQLLISVKEEKERNIHSTVKPIKLMAYLIQLGCQPDGIVLDPFVGSGTTCIAAKILKRKFIGIEVNREYINIAAARIDCPIYEFKAPIIREVKVPKKEEKKVDWRKVFDNA